ncbi:MAG: hypothetical protein MUF00_14785 [Gemmatimonadaceae bacterium]|jgi:hypothetical protein|nr:hypothetical protein [Gemmatimonadaceae bacterium]
MKRYFYAGSERQELEPDRSVVAVERMTAANAGLGDALSAVSVKSRLPSGMVLVSPDELTKKALTDLQQAGATRTVYRVGHSLVVPMADIRVEFDAEEQKRETLAVLKAVPTPVELVEESPALLLLRPTSGSSEDALDIANYLHEHGSPAAASVRMLHIVSRGLRGSERDTK